MKIVVALRSRFYQVTDAAFPRFCGIVKPDIAICYVDICGTMFRYTVQGSYKPWKDLDFGT